jgi:hypothetical protein
VRCLLQRQPVELNEGRFVELIPDVTPGQNESDRRRCRATAVKDETLSFGENGARDPGQRADVRLLVGTFDVASYLATGP